MDTGALTSTLLLSLVLSLGPAPHARSEAVGSVELIADGLDLPSNLASPRDGRERIYVTEQHEGEIRVIVDGRVLPQSFLGLRERIIGDPNGEEGLLGLAFSPGFPVRPYICVSYIGAQSDLVLSRFEVADSGLEAIASSEEVLLSLPRITRMHHCGHIEFGPEDGLLYLCIGDTLDNARTSGIIQPVAQNPNLPVGKILRMDVEPHAPVGALHSAFAAPSTSFEVWSMGLRNPWRSTFDPATGDMFIPDVSRYHWDEINFWPASGGAGGNFGWPLAEGDECVTECDSDDLVWPIYQYSARKDRCAVIGGAVYHGTAFPGWQGAFLFGDLCSGEIWALRNVEDELVVCEIAQTDLAPHSIGTRFDGEILVADSRRGAVWRLLLPAPGDAECIQADRAMFAMIADALRAGFSRSQEQLDHVLASRVWRWSRPIAAMYRCARILPVTMPRSGDSGRIGNRRPRQG